MKFHSAYRARHAAPRRSGPARVAGAATALALGAVPLAAATAQADAAPQSVASAGMALPLGLDRAVGPIGSGGLAGPAAGPVGDMAGPVADRLSSALPVAALGPQVLPASNGPVQVAPDLFDQGALGTFSRTLAPQAADLTGGPLNQTQPLVGELRTGGVPTVGGAATQLSGAALPGGGSVGGVTQSLPVSSMMNNTAPVADTLGNVSRL